MRYAGINETDYSKVKSLKKSILKIGLVTKIYTFKGTLLTGTHRLEALEELLEEGEIDEKYFNSCFDDLTDNIGIDIDITGLDYGQLNYLSREEIIDYLKKYEDL